MYTLGIDTSHLFLLLVLMNENKTVDSICMDCFKQQSEYIVVKIDELLKRNNLDLSNVANVVVTLGPGSYTGVRIGLTVAKILGAIVGKNIYTLSSLQLYSGKKKALVLMDAKAKRCYVGHYDNGQAVEQDDVLYNDEIAKMISTSDVELIGDLHLFGMQDNYPDFADNFMMLKDNWQKVDNIDTLTPTYLKNKEEYLKV